MNDKIRGATRSKTAWFGLALAVLGVVQAHLDVFGQFLSPAAQGLLTVGVGVAVVVLRWVTTDGLDEK